MTAMASQITRITIINSTVYSGADLGNMKSARHWHLCGNSPTTGEFPAQMASNAESVSIWWRHPVYLVVGILLMEKILSIWQEHRGSTR